MLFVSYRLAVAPGHRLFLFALEPAGYTRSASINDYSFDKIACKITV